MRPIFPTLTVQKIYTFAVFLCLYFSTGSHAGDAIAVYTPKQQHIEPLGQCYTNSFTKEYLDTIPAATSQQHRGDTSGR